MLTADSSLFTHSPLNIAVTTQYILPCKNETNDEYRQVISVSLHKADLAFS